ncbi:MAG: hypothetical protein ACRC67_37660 [Inquilinus sp.]|uniref:hypothetical protein n=1 Tax=Inquilinus sp. TaxID=1932117 RepID=UPI003F312EBF
MGWKDAPPVEGGTPRWATAPAVADLPEGSMLPGPDGLRRVKQGGVWMPFDEAPPNVASPSPSVPSVRPAPPASAGPGALSEGLSGLNEGMIGDVLGAPVDLTTAILNGASDAMRGLTGRDLGRIEDPIGGSRSINSVQEAVGTVQPPSGEYPRLRSATRAAGSAITSAVPIGAAARMTTPLRNADGIATAAMQDAGFTRQAVEPVLDLVRTSPLAAAGGDLASAAGAGAGNFTGNFVSGDDPLIAAIMTTAGGLLAPLATSGASSLTRAIFTDDPTAAEARLAAYERQGVRPTAASVGGGRIGTAIENTAEMAPLPANPVTRTRTEQQDQLSGRADEIARGTGGTPAADVDEFGNIIRREAVAGEGRIRADIARQEQDFARRFGNTTPVSLENTRAAIARMMERADPDTAAMLQNRLAMLDEATGTARQRADIQDTIGRLQALANDPAAGPAAQSEVARLQQQAAALDRVPFQVFDNVRKRIGVATDGQSIDAQFTGPIYGGLRADMEAAANARGLGDAWRQMKAGEERVYNSDRSPAEGGDLDLLAAASGSDGGGTLFNKFIGSNFQDGDRIGALLRNTTPEGRADIQASTVAYLGRAKPGQQNAAGDEFSAATFLTNWAKMSANAKAQIFGDDTQLMSDLDDIAKIAEGMRQVGRTSNYSNTARIGMTGGGAYGLTQLGLVEPGTALTALGGGYAGLHALVSSRLAQWAAGRGPSASARVAARLPGVFNAASPYIDPIAAVIMGRDDAARGVRAASTSTGDPMLDAVMR